MFSLKSIPSHSTKNINPNYQHESNLVYNKNCKSFKSNSNIISTIQLDLETNSPKLPVQYMIPQKETNKSYSPSGDYLSKFYHRKNENKDIRSEVWKYNSELYKLAKERNSLNLDLNKYAENNRKSDIFGKVSKELLTQDKDSQNHWMYDKCPSNIRRLRINNTESDVFNQGSSESDVYRHKTSEKFLFYNNVKKFSSITPSGSAWIPVSTRPSLMNHSSERFHILNPGMKHITRTKPEVELSTAFIPTHRQKSICEIYDIEKNGSQNKKYMEIYKTSKSPFNKNKGVCSNFSIMSKYYEDLCGPLFGKKKY